MHHPYDPNTNLWYMLARSCSVWHTHAHARTRTRTHAQATLRKRTKDVVARLPLSGSSDTDTLPPPTTTKKEARSATKRLAKQAKEASKREAKEAKEASKKEKSSPSWHRRLWPSKRSKAAAGSSAEVSTPKQKNSTVPLAGAFDSPATAEYQLAGGISLAEYQLAGSGNPETETDTPSTSRKQVSLKGNRDPVASAALPESRRHTGFVTSSVLCTPALQRDALCARSAISYVLCRLPCPPPVRSYLACAPRCLT